MPIPLPCPARSSSTVENGVSDLPTNIICDTGWVGSIQDILHLVIRQTMLFTTLPGVNTGSLHGRSLACQAPCLAATLFQAILTKEMNARLLGIFISTSLALHRDKHLYLKC